MRTKKRARKIGASLIGGILFLTSGTSLASPQSPQIEPSRVGESSSNKTKSIVGKVLDAHGSPVPRAIVLIKDMRTLQVRSYIAQDDGSYHFLDLSGDIDYLLRAQANGLTSPQKTVSVFNSHRVVTLNLKLKKKLKT